MNITDIINSGDVELYVYGVLSESETEQMADMSNKHKTLKDYYLSSEAKLSPYSEFRASCIKGRSKGKSRKKRVSFFDDVYAPDVEGSPCILFFDERRE